MTCALKWLSHTRKWQCTVPSTAVKSIQDINLPTLTEISTASYSSTVVSVCIRHIRMMQQKTSRKTLILWCNESSGRFFFTYCDVHSSETDYWKDKNVGWDLVQCIGCWLDGGKSESCLQSIASKLTKLLEKSGKNHQREISRFTGRFSYDY